MCSRGACILNSTLFLSTLFTTSRVARENKRSEQREKNKGTIYTRTRVYIYIYVYTFTRYTETGGVGRKSEDV